MKTLSLRLDNAVFADMESISLEMQLSRDQYIRDAVTMYNLLNKRHMLRKQLEKESGLVKDETMAILSEFDKL